MKIPARPEWDIIDSSKLDDFIRCKRYYFFSHILGWRPEMPNIHLIFGQAYHIGREHQLINGYDEFDKAYYKFLDEYNKYIHPDDYAIYEPKTPTAALMAYIKFNEERSSDLLDNEVVTIDGEKMTEIGGKVNIGNNRFLHYRMDSIMRRKEDGKIFSWDHKTTSENYITKRMWAEQFHLGIQNGTYTHCLYCLFPIEQVLGVEFCGAGFKHLKRGSSAREAGHHVTLQRVPAFKTPEQMNSWLWTVNDLCAQLELEMDKLSHCDDSDPTLMAFGMSPKSCTSFSGCPFHDYCLAWQNPLRQCEEPPLGFKEEFWNPAEQETKVKKDLTFGE